MTISNQTLERTSHFLGKGSNFVTNVADLQGYDDFALPSSPTYKSFTHFETAQIVEDYLTRRGWNITAEKFMVSRSCHQMYGYFDLGGIKGDHRMMVILRNSVDKTLSFRVCVGMVNTICENGLISLSLFESKGRKHQKNVDISQVTIDSLANMGQRFDTLNDKMIKLQDTPLSDYGARKQLMDLASKRCFPAESIMSIWDEYQNPTYEQFKTFTQHSMLMAITEQLKQIRTINTLMDYYKQLAICYDL